MRTRGESLLTSSGSRATEALAAFVCYRWFNPPELRSTLRDIDVIGGEAHLKRAADMRSQRGDGRILQNWQDILGAMLLFGCSPGRHPC